MESKKNLAYKASIIAVAGNALLAIIKISGGLLSGSMAVIGDGLDTTADIFSSIITLIASVIIMQPPNKKRPYGYAKADAVASSILSFVVIFAGLQLCITTLTKFFSTQTPELPSKLALYITISSIIGKIALTLILFSMGKRSRSSMLIANAKNMRGDIIISASILVGLLFTLGLELPIIDLLLAFVVGLWIVWVGVGIFKENNSELLDGIDDSAVYDKIFAAVAKVEGAYSPHRTRVRKNGPHYTIVLDIEVDGNTSVNHAHFISQCVENKIKEHIDNVYDIIVHIEPLGNNEDEKFGVAENNQH
ncbi:MAG: cation transporter [Bacteroidales bacterium]|nr:cation transporter [Bacteroidales bacterium]